MRETWHTILALFSSERLFSDIVGKLDVAQFFSKFITFKVQF